MRRDRKLARVRIVCAHFARNLAYYRARLERDERLTPDTQYWRTVHSNEVDIAVLEWLKLFGGKKEKHSWQRVMPNYLRYELSLYSSIGLNRSKFRAYVDTLKRHRDKFVAHLDHENRMDIPDFTVAMKSAEHFFNEVTSELDGLGQIPEDDMSLSDYYRKHFEEARAVFELIQS